MTVKLQTEHHLKLLSLKAGCTGSSESTLVKNCHIVGYHMSQLKYDKEMQQVQTNPKYREEGPQESLKFLHSYQLKTDFCFIMRIFALILITIPLFGDHLHVLIQIK